MRIARYIFLLAFTPFIFRNISCAQVAKLNSVKVAFEGFYTETFADVSCEAFDGMFADSKKTRTFYKQDDLLKFNLLMKGFKSIKKRSFDVRGKVVFYYRKKTSEYCFNTFGIFYKDGQFFYNRPLLIYISDKLYTNHPEYLDTLRQQ